MKDYVITTAMLYVTIYLPICCLFVFVYNIFKIGKYGFDIKNFTYIVISIFIGIVAPYLGYTWYNSVSGYFFLGWILLGALYTMLHNLILLIGGYFIVKHSNKSRLMWLMIVGTIALFLLSYIISFMIFQT